MIHICYGLHDKDGRYSKFTGASVVSIFENSTAPRFIAVHILHDNTLSQENRDKFNQIAGRYGQIIKFHNVEEKFPDKIEELKNIIGGLYVTRWSIGSFYRLLMCELFSGEIKKIIYLDSDIIVNLDINELWQIELGEKVLAAVPETYQGNPTQNFPLCVDKLVKPENYFNAGVLMINLEKLRKQEETLMNGIKFISEHKQYSWLDQDVLNYCFSNSMIRLGKNFNTMIKESREHGEFFVENKICHYNGTPIGLGLGLNVQDNFNRLWFKYFAKTPWFNEEIFGHIYEGVQQIYIWQKNFLTQVSAIQANKSRAFFVQPQNIPAVKQIFAVKESEEIIELVSDESIQNLIQSIKKSEGEKIFYIFFQNYRAIQIILLQAGFVEGRDFINGSEFLSDANGVPMDTYPLIKFL